MVWEPVVIQNCVVRTMRCFVRPVVTLVSLVCSLWAHGTAADATFPSSAPFERRDDTQSAQFASETVLWSSLMATYQASVIPPGGVKVDVELVLTGLQVSTSTETMTISAYWRLYWRDQRLSWNSTSWGVESLVFKPHELWVPDVTMYEKSQESEYSQEILVYPDGNVFLSSPRQTKFACPLVLARFPFDVQKCRFTIGSWSHDETRVDVLPRVIANPSEFFFPAEPSLSLPPRSAVDLQGLTNFHEFFLSAVRVVWRSRFYACCAHPYPTIRVELELQRSTMDYVSSIILPLIIVTCVGFGTLFMPSPSSGAKPALCVTILLTTATVFLAANNLTPNSNQTTLIGRLYIACLCTNLCTVIWSIWTTALILVQHDNSSSVQHFMDFFFHFDLEKKGRLDKDQVRCALEALGLNSAERDTLVRELFRGELDITEAQWAVVAALAHKSDKLAVYHNPVVQKLVTRAIMSDFKQHGANVGKGGELWRQLSGSGEEERERQRRHSTTAFSTDQDVAQEHPQNAEAPGSGRLRSRRRSVAMGAVAEAVLAMEERRRVSGLQCPTANEDVTVAVGENGDGGEGQAVSVADLISQRERGAEGSAGVETDVPVHSEGAQPPEQLASVPGRPAMSLSRRHRLISQGSALLGASGEGLSRRVDVVLGCRKRSELQLERVLGKLGDKMDQYAGVNSHPTAVGRRIAASGDSKGRVLLPLAFIVYLLTELVHSGVFASTTRYVPSVGGGGRQPVLFELKDFRGGAGGNTDSPRAFRSFFKPRDVGTSEFDVEDDMLVRDGQ